VEGEIPGLDCESEICDFGSTVGEKYVGSFEIAVNYVSTSQVFEPLVDIAEVWPKVRFGDGALQLEGFLEVTLFAEFSDDVAVVAALQYLMTLDDVGVAQLANYRCLLLQQFLQLAGGQLAQPHYLYRQLPV
jgi:hypothetical protein